MSFNLRYIYDIH